MNQNIKDFIILLIGFYINFFKFYREWSNSFKDIKGENSLFQIPSVYLPRFDNFTEC
jgi:hypothetical protein